MAYVIFKHGYNYYGGSGFYNKDMEDMGIEDDYLFSTKEEAIGIIHRLNGAFDVYEYVDWQSSKERLEPYKPYLKWRGSYAG